MGLFFGHCVLFVPYVPCAAKGTGDAQTRMDIGCPLCPLCPLQKKSYPEGGARVLRTVGDLNRWRRRTDSWAAEWIFSVRVMQAAVSRCCPVPPRIRMVGGIKRKCAPTSRKYAPKCAPTCPRMAVDFGGQWWTPNPVFPEGKRKRPHVCGTVRPSMWCPRQESNLYLPLRRGPFYPLNYGDSGARLYAARPPRFGARCAANGATWRAGACLLPTL